MKENQHLTPDYREFIELLNSHGVDYLITGAWGLAVHAEPRMTGDLDIVLRCTPENATKLERVMSAFGFGNTEPKLTSHDFLRSGEIIQLGYKPNRIDLLIDLFPVPFNEAWRKRLTLKFQGIPMHFLDRDSLIESKRVAGRDRDLIDIDKLEKTRPLEPKDEHEKDAEKEREAERSSVNTRDLEEPRELDHLVHENMEREPDDDDFDL